MTTKPSKCLKSGGKSRLSLLLSGTHLVYTYWSVQENFYYVVQLCRTLYKRECPASRWTIRERGKCRVLYQQRVAYCPSWHLWTQCLPRGSSDLPPAWLLSYWWVEISCPFFVTVLMHYYVPQGQPFVISVVLEMQCTWTKSLCAREQNCHWRSVCLSFLLSAPTMPMITTTTTTMITTTTTTTMITTTTSVTVLIEFSTFTNLEYSVQVWNAYLSHCYLHTF